MRQTSFKRWVLRLGATKSVVLITVVSLALSLLVTSLSFLISGLPIDPSVLLVAAIVPMIVAPLASSAMVNLLFELDEAHRTVHEQSITDALTGVHNRRHFFEAAQVEFARAQRRGSPVSLLMIDGDNFKRINDIYGHLCGDQVLQQIAWACRDSVRGHDLVARLGGEEFAVLLAEAGAAEAHRVAERIRHRIAESELTYAGQRVSFTVSIGVAVWQPTATPLEQVMNRADQALYRAKRMGKNRVELAELEADQLGSLA